MIHAGLWEMLPKQSLR